MRQIPEGAGCGRKTQKAGLPLPQKARRKRRHGAAHQRLSANAFLAMLLYQHFSVIFLSSLLYHRISMEGYCETGLRYHRAMTSPAGLFLGLNLPSSGPPPEPVLYHFHQYIP